MKQNVWRKGEYLKHVTIKNRIGCKISREKRRKYQNILYSISLTSI